MPVIEPVESPPTESTDHHGDEASDTASETTPAMQEGTTRSDGAARRRVRAVDVLRGVVLATMLLTPITGENGSYPLLAHAEWNGFTVSDAVFPAFLVTSGASLAFLIRPRGPRPDPAAVTVAHAASRGERQRAILLRVGRGIRARSVSLSTIRRLLRRLLALVVIGLLYNALGQPWDIGTIRVTGVLQTIGVSGFIAAVVVLLLRLVTRSVIPVIGVAVALPLLYGRSLAAAARDCTRPAANCSPWFDLDVAVFGAGRVYRMGEVGFDPEGIAVMVVASSLVLFGYVAGTAFVGRDVTWWRLLLILAGGGLLIWAGLAGDGIQPINKRLHTPAFTFLAAGIPVAALAVLGALLDLPLMRRAPRLLSRAVEAVRVVASHPFQTLGQNALVVYVLEHAAITVIASTMVEEGRTLRRELLESLPVDGDRRHLAFTAILLGGMLVVTYVMRLLRWRVAL